MSLSEEQRRLIRDEEHFREEVRKELGQRRSPRGVGERLTDFFETKAGFWLLTTALAGTVATGFGWLQRYLDRDEIATRERADRARRDTEMLLKLGPMLTSEKRQHVDMALVLLNGLASDKAVDGHIATQVRVLFESTLAAGLKPDATPEEKAPANAIIALADRPRLDAIQRADAEAQPANSSPTIALDDRALPLRVYIQIPLEAQRSRATDVSSQLKALGIVVPGIELVPERIAPRRNSVRYCSDKVDTTAPARISAAMAKAVSPAPDLVVLDPKLCGKVRFNHFEFWFARPAQT